MKKSLILFMMVLLEKNAICQTVDSSFLFSPTLIKKITKVARLDSVMLRDCFILFRKDTVDTRNLNIIIKDINGNLVEEGLYRLDTTRFAYTNLFNKSGDMVGKRIRTVEYHYLREGYWRKYRQKKIKEYFYHRGIKIEMKT
jgi:hypothetical protein